MSDPESAMHSPNRSYHHGSLIPSDIKNAESEPESNKKKGYLPTFGSPQNNNNLIREEDDSYFNDDS